MPQIGLSDLVEVLRVGLFGYKYMLCSSCGNSRLGKANKIMLASPLRVIMNASHPLLPLGKWPLL